MPEIVICDLCRPADREDQRCPACPKRSNVLRDAQELGAGYSRLLAHRTVERRMRVARSAPDIGHEGTTQEALAAGGPNFMAGEDTGESPEYHKGFDHAVLFARDNTMEPKR